MTSAVEATDEEDGEESGEEHAFKSIIHAGTLNTWLDNVGMFAEEFKLHITPEGYHTRVVCPSNVGMTDTQLDKRAFESHRSGTDNNGSLVVGLNIERLQDVLDLVEKYETDDTLCSVVFDEATRKMEIQYGDDKTRSIALIDPDTVRHEPDLPDFDLPVRVDIPPREFSYGVDSADLVSDHIEIGYDDGETAGRTEGLYFDATGDTDDAHHRPDDQEIHESGAADTLLSLEYLKRVEKVLPNDATVTITVGEDFPIIIEFDETDTHGEDNIETTVVMAPRIRSD